MDITLEKMLAPVKELNDLTLKSIEEISSIQVKAIQDSAKVSIDALKSSTEIKDIDSLKDYLQDQITVAQNISENTVKDAQEIAKLSESYASSVKELVEKSVATA
jgi:phasin family protein